MHREWVQRGAFMTDPHVSPPLLHIQGLTKIFPGVVALDKVDFTLRHGEVHALLGENGAGKSTLIKTLTGVYPRDGGAIYLEGQPIAPRSVDDAQRLQIGAVYQEVNLLPNLPVAENLFLGRQPTRFGIVKSGQMRRDAQRLLKTYNLDIDVSENLGSYSVAIQQIVAIARAVDLSAKVLILDEPTASLDHAEVEMLFNVIRALKQTGIGIVFITHFLDQVYAISDRITVLRNGRLVGERATADLPRLDLVTMMLGRELDDKAQKISHERISSDGVPVASFEGYGKSRYLAPFDLSVRAGEVVGVSGLLGSGRTETAKLIFGAMTADKGRAFLDGQPIVLKSPRDAIHAGFGYCPEDRKAEGIVGELSVRENIVLALQARRGWLSPLPYAEQQKLADHFIEMLDIRPHDAERPIQFLSGGNQQKALLARWLATEPRFLILDEPTRGIDVGAHAEIIHLIDSLCQKGMALLVISSELEEIVSYSTRVIVLRDRHHVGELTGEEISVNNIMKTIAATSAEAKP